MSSPFPWRPEARQRVARHRRSAGNGQPIRRREAPVHSRYFQAAEFPLIFGCCSDVNSLIGRKIRLIGRVTNLTPKCLNCRSVLCRHPPQAPAQAFLGTFFSVSVFPTRSCPRVWCKSGVVFALRRIWPVSSGCHGRQLEDRILTQWSDSFQGHLAGALHGPFIVLLKQDGADQAGNGVLVGKDADDVGAALDLAIKAL
jgi:hypothetical protein